MPLTATGVCSFLHPDKLCGIQKRHGADALSVTCATYPRAASLPGGVAEEALNLSCPEAARVTLLEPNMLTGWYWPPQGPGRYAAIAYAGDQPIARSSVRLAIREFILALVGDRSYPLWQRMILLGNLTRRLQALSGEATVAEWADSNPAAVAHLLADSANSAATHRLQPLLDDFQPQPGPQLQFVMQVLRGRMSQPPISNRFRECVADCESGLGCATATSEQEILDNYNRAYRLYYQPLMERNPHILENYLMNYVFKNGFPFLRHAAVHADARVDAETEHLLLCVFTALTQTLLIGMAGHYAEAFDLTHVVKLVQTLARTFEHSLQAMNEIAVLVHAQGLNNLRGIALMLQP
jgi:lysine-N-methylase